ncbi:hypothetical protein [Robertmurraya kyonggiensis]|uniref:Uncharacterized protein n=1 Tax=Robertmurraya kyonggiensis TaxID=1037680 RepID=A0A4U1D1W3_9BACI|nr:hypothetical protein [Robertmurraya kyonggiensis]TKC16305.1 hypothetical protein FA727_15245 [Robertmurraya kyonggiensis]
MLKNRMIRVVTFTFTMIFSGLLLMIALIDMFIWQQSFYQCVSKLFALDEGANEGYVIATAAAGFIYSIASDYRIRKKKRSQQS